MGQRAQSLMAGNEVGNVRYGQPSTRMRVVLHNTRTKKYFRTGHRWTERLKDAMDFRDGWRAIACACEENPRDLAILYDFADDRYNLDIPLHSLPGDNFQQLRHPASKGGGRKPSRRGYVISSRRNGLRTMRRSTAGHRRSLAAGVNRR
jgi:hypothetical protein